jgi:hypothetical protein
MNSAAETVTLYRPIGMREMTLLRDAGWRAFPPRSRGQPSLCMLTDQTEARQIAREWLVPVGGAGFVARFTVAAAFLQRAEPQSDDVLPMDYVIPARELGRLNEHLSGPIELIEAFFASPGVPS